MISPLPDVDLVDLVDDLPHHARHTYAVRPLAAIDRIVVHHSATPANTTPGTMARYHVQHHGWPGIGYHFVVASDGTLYRTNLVETHTYHVAGWNRRSVGVCFVGDFTHHAPPVEQVRAGARLIGWLLAQLNLNAEHVVGHGELVATACPGRQWLQGARWNELLLQEIVSWLNKSTA